MIKALVSILLAVTGVAVLSVVLETLVDWLTGGKK